MSRTGFMGMLDRALDLGISARRTFNVNGLDGKRVTTPVPLIAAPQAVVLMAADAAPTRQVLNALGPEIAVDGFTRVSLWVTFTIGAMTGVRFACYALHTSGGTKHRLPIYNPVVTAAPYRALITFEEMVYADEGFDSQMVITWDVANTHPFIQFGVGATADPGVDASILTANVTYGWA